MTTAAEDTSAAFMLSCLFATDSGSGYVLSPGDTGVNMMTGELRPAAPLRRDEALAYIIRHIIRHGFSPTHQEIAEGLGGISEARVKQLVAQLIKLGSVIRTPGKQRNLRVRDLSESRHHVTEALRRLQWPVADAMGELQQPYPQGQLPRVPRLRQRPGDPGDTPA